MRCKTAQPACLTWSYARAASSGLSNVPNQRRAPRCGSRISAANLPQGLRVGRRSKSAASEQRLGGQGILFRHKACQCLGVWSKGRCTGGWRRERRHMTMQIMQYWRRSPPHLCRTPRNFVVPPCFGVAPSNDADLWLPLALGRPAPDPAAAAPTLLRRRPLLRRLSDVPVLAGLAPSGVLAPLSLPCDT